MRKFTITLFLAIISVQAICQVVISNDSGEEAFRNLMIEFKVIDKESSEPIGYASAYLVPEGDTLITNFCMSSPDGKVKFKNVPKGIYEVNVEILGYEPFKKVYSINSYSSVPKVIRIAESDEAIDAAKITGLLTPVEYRKDTIIYNAGAFHVGDNAMLEDLLKKMPGIEVQNGKVTANGKEIKELTVNGKTFFFGDQSVALKNLPARIVNKIKVIEKLNREASSTGIHTATNKEQVMDVELKEEFSKGVFGNVSLSGGAGWNNGIEGETKDTKTLYKAHTLDCAYNAKDQLTIVAGGDNISKGKGYADKAAANINSTRIKGFETTMSVIVGRDRNNDDKLSDKSYFLSDDSSFDRTVRSYSDITTDRLKTELKMSLKGNDKYTLEIHPQISFAKNNSLNGSKSDSYLPSSGYTSSWNDKGNKNCTSASFWMNGGIHDIGKKGRDISFAFEYDYKNSDETKDEYTFTDYGSASIERNIGYAINGERNHTLGSLLYIEPFSERLSVNIRGIAKDDYLSSDISASDSYDGSPLPLYSSNSNVKNMVLEEAVFIKHGSDKIELSAGGKLEQTSNVNTSKYQGISTVKGRNDWETRISPYLYFSTKEDRNQLYLEAFSSPLSSEAVTPALNISTPTDISTGNIYLKKPYSYNCLLQISNYSKYALNIIINSKLDSRSIVRATWFDKNGTRYSFPVNSKKTGGDITLFLMFSKQLGRRNNWQFHFNASGKVESNTGYQAEGTLDGLDTASFDYAAFLDKYYGNNSGDLFYSGNSGFRESRTGILDISCDAVLRYRTSNLCVSLTVSPKYYESRYSLVKTADRNIRNIGIKPEMDYKFDSGLYASTYMQCNTYRGYGSAYDKKTFDWGIDLSKDIKMITLSLECRDILNNTVAMEHSATAEYIMNTVSRNLGRRILVGITYNFGKANTKIENKAENFVRHSAM